jgi:hypothetical protein
MTTKKWRIEVEVKVGGEKVWKPVSPTNGPPYEYDDENEAYRMMKMCYGDPANPVKARIKQTNESN